MNQDPTKLNQEINESADRTEPTEPTDALQELLAQHKAIGTDFVTKYVIQEQNSLEFEQSNTYRERVENDASYERLGLETVGVVENGEPAALYNVTLAYVLDQDTKKFDRPNDGEGSIVINVIPLPGSDVERRLADVLQLGTDSDKSTMSVGFVPNAGRIEITGNSAEKTSRLRIDITEDDPEIPQEIAQFLAELSDSCAEQLENPGVVRVTKRFMN